MNISNRKVYVIPEVRIVKVCQENLMQEFTSWDTGNGKMPIVKGNPDEERDNYDEWY